MPAGPVHAPITCDLSVAVAHDEGEETLGDRVRDALGGDALGSDALGGDALGSDALGGDALGSDALGSDALGSDALGSDALGSDAQCVEEVRALSATDCDRLPVSAARRLGAKRGQAGPSGAKRGQKNLLVRVVLRDLEKTLTNEAANALRDRIHLAIHQGTEYQWAHQAAQPGAA
ncbi:MAG: hypothetical protein ACRDOH_32310 [Streptosporangiaceae bacterium]